MTKGLTRQDRPIHESFKPPSVSPCGRCGWPVEAGDRHCPSCGLPQTGGQTQAGPLSPRVSECTSCGAPIEISPTERSYTCGYCGSTFVFDYSGTGPEAQEPEFVLPFQVSADEAKARVERFLGTRRFVPSALKSRLASAGLTGVYLPCWHFSASARSDWSVRIGEYWYTTETYTVVVNGRPQVRTRQVRHTEWWPLTGKFHRFWSGCLVPATPSISQEELDAVGPFRLEALKRYRPEFLAGWPTENYTVPRETALLQAEKTIRQGQEQAIIDFLPGDTYQGLRVQTNLEHLEADLVLLPVYFLHYEWKGTKRRLLVNGQTGKVAGSVPRDWKRLILTIVIVLAALVLIRVIAGFFAPSLP